MGPKTHLHLVHRIGLRPVVIVQGRAGVYPLICIRQGKKSSPCFCTLQVRKGRFQLVSALGYQVDQLFGAFSPQLQFTGIPFVRGTFSADLLNHFKRVALFDENMLEGPILDIHTIIERSRCCQNLRLEPAIPVDTV